MATPADRLLYFTNMKLGYLFSYQPLEQKNNYESINPAHNLHGREIKMGLNTIDKK